MVKKKKAVQEKYKCTIVYNMSDDESTVSVVPKCYLNVTLHSIKWLPIIFSFSFFGEFQILKHSPQFSIIFYGGPFDPYTQELYS